MPHGPGYGIIVIGEALSSVYNRLRNREIIFSNSVDSDTYDALAIIKNTEDLVQIEGENPYGGTELSDEVDPTRAAKVFADVESELESGNYLYRTRITYDDRSIKYEIGQNDGLGASVDNVIKYEGTIAQNVDKQEVEEILNSYGLNRHVNGWAFSVHDSLEDFQTPDNSYSIGSDELKSAVIGSEIDNLEYFGKEGNFESDEEAEELVSELLEGREVGSIEVREFDMDSRVFYEVDVEDFYTQEDRLSLTLVSGDYLFQNDCALESDEEILRE